MVQKYPHIHKASVDIESLRWSRIPVQGVEHKHSFVRDGDEKRLTTVKVRGPVEVAAHRGQGGLN
jgi:urate oxidase